MITDLQRLTFMQQLAKSVRDAHGLQLTEWESHFVGTFCQSSRPTLWFTAGRRQATDRMWQKYGAVLKLPYPESSGQKSSVLVPAEDAACEFFVKLDGRQQRCNDPAAYVNKLGFRYCQAHGDHVQRDLRRRGGHMELRAYRPGGFQ